MSLYDTLLNELVNFDIGNYSQEKREARIAICQSCDKFKPEDHVCSVCKCSIAVATMFAPNSCPEGKWRGEGVHE